MRLFSNKDVTGKKRLLTFKGTKGLAGIELNLKRELYAPAEITPITDCPLDQNKVWIKYDWNNRRIDPTFDGQLVIRDINEIVCNPGEAEIGSPIPYYGYPIALEPGATYRLTVNFEGQARVRARYNVDGEWLRADKTTLGADDGIGMVIILAVLTDKNDYEREVIGIFTDDEEVGLVGAHTTKERLKIATVRMCHMQIKELFKELK